jgi:hypothetical protein
MTVKINYDTQTTLVIGYYPDSDNYASIPEPFIEVSDEEYQDSRNTPFDAPSKQMCVVNGVFQEYVAPDSVLLANAKAVKISQMIAARDVFIYAPIPYNGSNFINSQIAGNNLQAAYNFFDEPIQWLDNAGNLVVLTKAQVLEIIQLMMARRASGYFQEADFTKQIMACTTVAQVQALNISFS